MNSQQRKFVSDKLGNLGNFAIVAMVFGQLLSREPVRHEIFWFGIAFWAIFMLVSFLLLRGGE